MEKVYMVFNSAETSDGRLGEPIAAFHTFEEAEKFASYSVFNGSYRTCMIGTYDVQEKNEAVPPKRVIFEGILTMNGENLDSVDVTHSRPFKEGEDVSDRLFYIKPTPSYDGDGILVYEWEAIEDIDPETDVFNLVKQRIEKKLIEKAKDLDPNY